MNSRTLMALWCAIGCAFAEVQILAQDRPPARIWLQQKADHVLSTMDKRILDELRKSPDASLWQILGKPGFMAVVNQIDIDAIPEWGLHNKRVIAQCVLNCADAKARHVPFDLLACLESVVANLGTAGNLPIGLESEPPGFELSHAMFRVSESGDVTILYVCSDYTNKAIRVLETHGKWRVPNADEAKRILQGRRAVQLGVPFENY